MGEDREEGKRKKYGCRGAVAWLFIVMIGPRGSVSSVLGAL